MGWRSGSTLKKELGDEYSIVYETLYPNGKIDTQYESTPCVILGQTSFIISWYHPGRATREYREKVLGEVEKLLK